MIKREVLELKKQFIPDNSVITQLCGCYVDGNKNIMLKFREKFHSLSEEDTFKYLDIFKKSLSGSIGKNLFNMSVTSDKDELLQPLLYSKLEDIALVDTLFNRVIENYDYGQNYYIILIHGVYDIPGKTFDGVTMVDASDEVYDYILCSICPVNLSKSGLGYDAKKNIIGERIRDWVVDAPDKAFLFPAFNERSTDTSEALYFSKKVNDIQPNFIENVLNCSKSPISAPDQKKIFDSFVCEILRNHCNYEIVKNINNFINEMIEDNDNNVESLQLDKHSIKHIFEQSDVPEECMNQFDRNFSDIVGKDTNLLATNLVNTKNLSISTPVISIKVDTDRTDLIETRNIDGRNYIMIAVDACVEINGIEAKIH